ncbi:MAG: hypothetical protein QM737_23900 [Ferruginibacter sp.]
MFGGAYYSYYYLAVPVSMLGATIAANRLIALGVRRRHRPRALSGADAHPRRHCGPRRRRRSGRGAAGRNRRARGRRHWHLRSAARWWQPAACWSAMFLTFNADYGRRLHHEGADRRHHGRRRQHRSAACVAGLMLGLAETAVARLVDPGLTLAVNYALFLIVLLVRPTGPVWKGGAMNARAGFSPSVAIAIALLAIVPLFANGYHLALGITLAELHGARDRLGAVLRADALHLARHRRVLRHRRLHGRGTRRGDAMAAGASDCGGFGVVVALIVGLSTLRLSGIYFVIFTFGLSELIRQLVTWYEINITTSLGRYIFRRHHAGATSTGSCSRSLSLVFAARLADRAARGSASRCA